MHSFSRRGLAAVALAALLVVAPLASTAAYADDEPAVDPAVVAPSEAAAESANAPETLAEPAPDALAEPSAKAPVESIVEEPTAQSASRAPQYEYNFGPGDGAFPIYVGIADTTTTTATVSWDPTTYGETPGNSYRVSVFDYTAGGFVLNEYHTNELTLDVTLIHGHHYWVSFNDGIGSEDRADLIFDFPRLPAPNAATGLSAKRLLDANGYALSWSAPADNTDNPVTAYQVEVSNGSSSRFYWTTAPVFTADELETGTTYGFAVVAVSDDGQRANGVSAARVVLAPVAPTAPETAGLSNSGSTLLASWTPPAYDGGASINGYSITLFTDGVSGEPATVFGGAYAFPADAVFGVEYTFSISVKNSGNLVGAATDSNTVEREFRAPTTPMTFANPAGYKDASIFVTWSAWWEDVPAPESATLTLYNVDGSVAAEKVLDIPGDPFWLFEGLASNTDYTVSVILTNAAGSSTEGAHTPVHTFGTVPLAATEEDVLASPNFNNVTASLTGSQITAHLDDVAPGEWVFGYAYSTPTALGWTQVDADGFARWSIAGAGLATGATHTLSVLNNFGFQLGFAAFAVPAAAPVPAVALAHTGTDSTTWITFGAGLLALGAVLMVRRRARA